MTLPIQYTGFAALKKVVNSHRGKLCSNRGDSDQYIAFGHVSQGTFEEIDANRLQLVMKAALSYFPDTETLIVKIPTRLQEKAHQRLRQLILMKTVAPINLDINDFSPIGKTIIKVQNGSSKESDSSWKNENIRPRDEDFPCLVVEAGMPESLSRLRGDARWCIESSGGKVNMVVIIWIRKTSRVLHIEKYIPAPPQTLASPGHPRPSYTRLASTVIINSAASPSTITGPPLGLGVQQNL